jgi:Glycosyltransferase family 87
VISIRSPHFKTFDPRGALLRDPRASLVDTVTPFTDFTTPAVSAEHFGEPDILTGPYLDQPYPYPVPSIYVYLFFVRLFQRPLLAELVATLAIFYVATALFSLRVHRVTAAALPQVAIWLTFLLGFPLLFLLYRGNIEGVIWMLVLLGTVAFARSRVYVAAIFWSLGASMKLNPAIYFALFLSTRKYRIFAFSLVLTLTISLLALAGIGPTLSQAIRDSTLSGPFLRDWYIIGRNIPYFDHSLFGTAKEVAHAFSYAGFNDKRAIENMLLAYDIVVPLAGILLYWFRLRHLPLLNQFISYVVLFLLLPQVSYEYKLVHVYLIWGAFLLFLLEDVGSGRVAVPESASRVIFISCSVLCAPLAYLMVELRPYHVLGIGGQIKMIFLVAILWTVLKHPMPSSLFGDLQTLPSNSLPEPASN